MLYCGKCKVHVTGTPRRCPLCQGELTGAPEGEDSFPRAPLRLAPHRLLLRLLLLQLLLLLLLRLSQRYG